MTVQVFRWEPNAKGTCVLVCRDCAAGHDDVGREVERYDFCGDTAVKLMPAIPAASDRTVAWVDTISLSPSFRWKCWTCREEQPANGPVWTVVIESVLA